MAPVALVAWASCMPGFDAPPPPGITDGPRILAAESPDIALVQMLEVSTDVPTLLKVVLEGAETRREISFPQQSMLHRVPLLGLVEQTEYEAIVSVAAANGTVATADPVTVPSAGAFMPAPDRRLLARDPTRMEPGYTLYPTKYFSVVGNATLEAVDDRGRVVWQYRPSLAESSNGSSVNAVQFHPEDGTVSALVNGTAVRRFDFANTSATTWASAGDAIAGDISVEGARSFHDEAAFELDGSFWTLFKQDTLVDDYPTDSSDVSVTGPAVLDEDVVAHVGADGTLLGTWPLTSYLDPHRIGFNATDQAPDGRVYWSGANAVVPLGDGRQTFLVSSRNQDAVVKVHGDTNETAWILANHDGWSPEYVPWLLDPVGTTFTWPSHQHAPAVDSVGRLLLFDNGNWEHLNPYQGPPPALDTGVSRLVRYDIDEQTGSVAESFTFVADAEIDPLFARELGNADPLPNTHNVLGTFAALEHERGIVNVDAGLGIRSMRIIEVDSESGLVVWDLGLNGPSSESGAGWQGDRAIRVPSLYPADVTVTLLDYGP